jgi:nucleoside-diphosphate-sugar epimerase
MRADDTLTPSAPAVRMDPPIPLGRALVNGASGFIGRHLSDALAAAGVAVVRTARSTGFDVMTDELPLDGVDHVFHLAAATDLSNAWQDPLGTLQTNCLGTIRVLDQCRRRRCPVTLASSYVYGPQGSQPIDENQPVRPANPYALSKVLAEEAGRGFAALYDLPVTVLRIFNVYGPGQSDRFVVPHIMRQVLDPSCPEVVVVDLAPRRDYVHIDDVVRAFAATAGFHGFGIFNVGTGVSHSVEDVIRLACVAAGVCKPWRQTGAARIADVPDTVAAIARIAEALGWRPRVSLADGLRGMATPS